MIHAQNANQMIGIDLERIAVVTNVMRDGHGKIKPTNEIRFRHESC
jgi:hypothetical protein